MTSNSRYYTLNFAFASICTRKDPRTGQKIYFIPVAEDEVIMEVVKNKFYRPLVNPLKKKKGKLSTS